MSISDHPIKPIPPPLPPEWAPIKDRPHWFIHKDGIRKAYSPDSFLPPADTPPPVDIELDEYLERHDLPMQPKEGPL